MDKPCLFWWAWASCHSLQVQRFHFWISSLWWDYQVPIRALDEGGSKFLVLIIPDQILNPDQGFCLIWWPVCSTFKPEKKPWVNEKVDLIWDFHPLQNDQLWNTRNAQTKVIEAHLASVFDKEQVHSQLWKRSRLPKATSPGNPMVTSYLTPEMRMCLTSFCCSWDAWLEIVKRRRLRCTIWHSVLLFRTFQQFPSIWSGQVWRHFRTFKKGKADCQLKRNLPYLGRCSEFDHWRDELQ